MSGSPPIFQEQLGICSTTDGQPSLSRLGFPPNPPHNATSAQSAAFDPSYIYSHALNNSGAESLSDSSGSIPENARFACEEVIEQPTDAQNLPFLAMGSQGTFITYALGNSDTLLSYGNLDCSQDISASSAHGPLLTPYPLDRSQSASSFTDTVLQSSNWTASSRTSLSSGSGDLGHSLGTHSQRPDDHAQRHSPSIENNHSCSLESDLNFIIEDPSQSQSFRERKPRSKLDLEKQKEDIRQLKQFGGACLWCYRSKKKCGAADICPLCLLNGRKCIRNSVQLSLVAPMVYPTIRTSVPILGPPSREALHTLRLLAQNTYNEIPRLNAVIHIRNTETNVHTTWALEMAESHLDIFRATTKHAVSLFLNKASTYVPRTRLEKFQSICEDHSLVREAMSLLALFTTVHCLARTHVYMSPLDLTAGRMTLFLIMMIGCRELAELSERFAANLCEYLRRKEFQNSGSDANDPSRSSGSLNAVWLATALYYRVVSGLENSTTSPLIGLIFGPLKDHLATVRSFLFSILKTMPAKRSKNNSKISAKQLLNDQIPALPTDLFFDLAFWPEPVSPSEDLPASAVVMRHEDPFAEQRFDMESLLESVVCESPKVNQALPIRTSLPDREARLETMQSPIDPNRLDEIIASMLDIPWEMVGSMASSQSACQYV